MSGTHFYGVWVNIVGRCSNPKTSNYEYYGGRGIKVCDRWLTFENFRDDMFSTYVQGLQLDRIDNNGDYEPENCQWTTRSKNGKNKRNKAAVQSSHEGVSWVNNKWRARLDLGSFSSEDEASAFYQKIRDYAKSLK